MKKVLTFPVPIRLCLAVRPKILTKALEISHAAWNCRAIRERLDCDSSNSIAVSTSAILKTFPKLIHFLTYQERLIDPRSNPVTSPSVQFNVQLRTPGVESQDVRGHQGASCVVSTTQHLGVQAVGHRRQMALSNYL